MAEALVRTKQVRAGHRSSATKTIGQVCEALEEERINYPKLIQQKTTIQAKMELLSRLDKQILDAITHEAEEEEFVEEIETADGWQDKIQSTLIDIDAALAKRPPVATEGLALKHEPGPTPDALSRDAHVHSPVPETPAHVPSPPPRILSPLPRVPSPPPRVPSPPPRILSPLPRVPSPPPRVPSPPPHVPSPVPVTPAHVHSPVPHGSSPVPVLPGSSRHTGSKVKLPKLILKRFSGDPTNWMTFWDSFESAVHTNPDLTSMDKFNYLHSLLDKSAAEVVSGLKLTGANYEEAISILRKRFGNKQQIVNKHMDALLNLELINPCNLKSLRQFFDRVESHVRGLRALDVASSSYSGLLSSVLMSKLPSDVRLVVSRKVPDAEWNLDSLMKVVDEEIDARERASMVPAQPTVDRQQGSQQKVANLHQRLCLRRVPLSLVSTVTKSISHIRAKLSRMWRHGSNNSGRLAGAMSASRSFT